MDACEEQFGNRALELNLWAQGSDGCGADSCEKLEFAVEKRLVDTEMYFLYA